MTLYVDSSAFARRYLADEPGHVESRAAMDSDGEWVTSRLTLIEVHRALSLTLDRSARVQAIAEFDADLSYTAVADIDSATCAIAADIAVENGVRSLDAIHLATALRVMEPGLRVLTHDVRQARAAAVLGIDVIP